MTLPLRVLPWRTPSLASATASSLSSFSPTVDSTFSAACSIGHSGNASAGMVLSRVMLLQRSASGCNAEPGSRVAALASGPAVPGRLARALRRGDEPDQSRGGRSEDETGGSGAHGAPCSGPPRWRRGEDAAMVGQEWPR